MQLKDTGWLEEFMQGSGNEIYDIRFPQVRGVGVSVGGWVGGWG